MSSDESKYCLTTDGAGVGTLYQNTCPPPNPGSPVPFVYIIGPSSSDSGAQPNCAQTDPTTNVQSFSKGACPSGVKGFTFYTYNAQVPGQPPLCFLPPAVNSVKGTAVTTNPNQVGACSMNLFVKYQTLTCNELGCGDHGTCTNGVCVCSDYWTGKQCENPPTGNAGCTPDTPNQKSCGNLGSYGTCQSAASTTTGITGTGQCTCDITTSQTGTFCEQACSVNDGTACGGPLRGFCVDGNYNYYSNNNAVKNRCVCVNGWSGNACTIPPPGWQCNDTDQLCTNLTTEDPKNTVPTGTCANGVCTCNNFLSCSSTNTQGGAFTGQACQTPLPVAGNACTQDSNCTSPQTCINGTCTCPGGNPAPDDLLAKLCTLVTYMLTTAKGIESLTSVLAIQKGLPMLLKYMTTKALDKGFTALILKRITDGVAGKFLGSNAIKLLEESVGKRLAAKVMAKMTATELAEGTITTLSSRVAETAFKDVFGFVGKIDSFVNLLGMLGMILDANDVLGLNEMSSQSQLDAIMKKFTASVNSNKTVLENGLYFPIKQYADSSFPFLLQTVTTDSRNQFATDVGNYISHLTVNSNNVAIIPVFPSAQQKQKDQLQAEAQGTVLYALAGNNLDVYQRLKQDWPIIVAGILVAIGVLVGSAFGIKALVNKKKVGKQ